MKCHYCDVEGKDELGNEQGFYFCWGCLKERDEKMRAAGRDGILDDLETWFKGAQMIPNYDTAKNGLALIQAFRGDRVHKLGIEKQKEAKK